MTQVIQAGNFTMTQVVQAVNFTMTQVVQAVNFTMTQVIQAVNFTMTQVIQAVNFTMTQVIQAGNLGTTQSRASWLTFGRGSNVESARFSGVGVWRELHRTTKSRTMQKAKLSCFWRWTF